MARINGNRTVVQFHPSANIRPKNRMIQTFLLATTAALAGSEKGHGIIGPHTTRYRVPDANVLRPALAAEEAALASFIDLQIPPAQQALAQSLKTRVNSIVQSLTAIDEGVILPFNTYEFRDQWFYDYVGILQNFRSELARSVEWIGLKFDDAQLGPFVISPNLTEGALPPFLRESIFTFVSTQHPVSVQFLETNPETNVARPITEQTQIRDVFRVVSIRLGSAIRGTALFE